MNSPDCPLCRRSDDEHILWQDRRCRVILVDDPDHAGFCRVIWHRHVREMTDLAAPDRAHLMQIVFATEQALRVCTQADKINLASLGNQVAHLHWHVIARFADDRHFPATVWSPPQRPQKPKKPLSIENLYRALQIALAANDGKQG